MDKKKILIVDDSRLIIQMIKSILGRSGYEFSEATSGKKALELIESEHPDLVLLDLNLPDHTGDEICRRIRKNLDVQHTSIIIITVSGNEEQKEKCYRAGCNDFITKPVEPNELRHKINRLLNIAARVPYRILVKLNVEGSDHSEFIFGSSVNISETGLMVETQNEIEVGSEVNVDFYLTSPMTNIRAKGKVIREDKRGFRKAVGYGIRFTEIQDSARSKINKMIKKRSAE